MQEIKFIFTGTPGVGKTSAIESISDAPPVITSASENFQQPNSTTKSVAMDFGEITLLDDTTIQLYGIPGQERFRFIWEVIIRGGLGLIILIDSSRPSPLDDLDIYLDNFADFIDRTSAVIGVTRMEITNKDSLNLDDYSNHITKRNLSLPIFPIDTRKREDITLILDSLMAMLEFN